MYATFVKLEKKSDTSYVVHFPAFPGLTAVGNSEATAFFNAGWALASFIKVMQDERYDLPPSATLMDLLVFGSDASYHIIEVPLHAQV